MPAINLVQRVAQFLGRTKAPTGVVHGSQLVPGFRRDLPKRGTRELLQAYENSPVLQAVIRKISSSMAAVKWVAKFKTPNGDLIEVPGHIAEKLINSGVPGLDGVQCRMLENTFLELVGESFALLERNQLGAPEARWPLPPHWLHDVPSPGASMFFVQPPGGTPFEVPRKNMLWHKDANPLNPYGRGTGIARSLADELNADEAAAKHTAASLTNRARPDIIVSGSKEVPLNKDDAKRLNEVWTQRFGGPENQGKPFVSASPISVDTLTPTFKELELSKMREFERDIIIAVFGVPPEVMGVLENSNRATIDAAWFLFAKGVLLPRLDARKAVYNEQLAPQYDERLIIDYVDPVAENKEFKQIMFATRPSAFSDDEARLLAGEDKLPGGQGEFRPESNGEPVAIGDSGIPEKTMRKKAVSEDDMNEMLDAVDPAILAAVLLANSRTIIAEFSADALDEIGSPLDFDVDSPKTVEFLRNVAGDRSNLINATTREALRDTLAAGITAGDGKNDLIERVRAVIEEASESRAATIARTEVNRAANFGTVEALTQAGIEEKEWLATRGTPLPPARGATRDTHRGPFGMDRQKQPIDEPFRSPSGALGMYPGDFGVASEDINCRCDVISPDSAADEKTRDTKSIAKSDHKDRLESTFSRQIRSVFREQGQNVVEVIERKDNG
jgi:hypothetical protein